MKQLRTSLAMKTAMVILTVLMISALFFSALAVAFYAITGAYTNPQQLREDYTQSIARQLTYDVHQTILETYWDDPTYDGTLELTEEYLPENTNLRFTVTDPDGTVLLANEASPSADAYSYQFEIELSRDAKQETRAFYNPEDATDFFAEINGQRTQITSTSWDSTTDENGTLVYLYTVAWDEIKTKDLVFTYSLIEPLTIKDNTYYFMQWAELLLNMRWVMLIIFAGALLLTIILLVNLCWAAGWRKGKEEPTPNFIDRIPLDLYLGIIAGLVTLTVVLWIFIFEEIENLGNLDLLIVFIIATVLCALFLSALLVSLILTFATRMKCKTILRNTIIWRILRLCWRIMKAIGRFFGFFIKNLPLYWKAGIVICALLVLEFFVLLLGGMQYFFILLCWIGGNLVLIPVAIYCIIQFKQLHSGATRIAGGDTAYRMDTKYMVLELKAHGETLNGIRDGLQKAVDERMKSERFKTELITNVSHDIKTPLTSIINYVDLLKKEELESETAQEYIEVLDRQSARLKKLIEDLVEASKASTGNLSVNAESIDLNLLLSQTIAEFHEKLVDKELEVITQLTADQRCTVTADGRLLWRVMENLMSNVCKYAQEHTRVYLSTEIIDDRIRVTLKNTSKYALNISSEELMERFTRGDASRHTEGSGLGLSIARSLVDLQKGRFDVVIDGDLFKVMIDLPRT